MCVCGDVCYLKISFLLVLRHTHTHTQSYLCISLHSLLFTFVCLLILFCPFIYLFIYLFILGNPLLRRESCADKMSNCQAYGSSVCSQFQQWANDNCRKFCKICRKYNIQVYVYR